jgi:hypothetical protein
MHAGSTTRLGRICGATLDMLWMETVAGRMADYLAGHHPTMPGSGKTAQAVDAARCLEDSAHASIMTSVPRPGKTTAAAGSTELRSGYAPPLRRSPPTSLPQASYLSPTNRPLSK